VTAVRTAVEHIMGTAISLAAPDTVDPEVFAAAAQSAFGYLRQVDEVFSPFRADSPISRIRDGRLLLADLGGHPNRPEILEVVDLCAALKASSRGAFDAWAVGDPPCFDPCGVVKGWSAERASALLAAHGVDRHILNAGGDVRLRGGRVPAEAEERTEAEERSEAEERTEAETSAADPRSVPWRVGLTDPHRPGSILAVLPVTEGAVATSGTAERGAHIWNPTTGRPATALTQVTVTGPLLTLADGYATAAMAMAGDSVAAAHAWLDDLAARTGYQSLTVDPVGRTRWTAGLPGIAPDHAVLPDASAAGLPGGE
jgi:thiamine biosynthesis lipoprotein